VGDAINKCCATSIGASQVEITVEDDSSVPIQGAQIDIYDATNTTFLTRLFSDVNGQVNIAIDDGIYKVRLFASGYSFVVPETLTVSGDGQVTYQGVSFLSVSPASSPELCVIFGLLRDVGGNPVAGANVEAYAVTPQVGGGYQIGPQIAATISDTNGYFELELLRDALVQFKVADVDLEVIKTVPDAPSQYLTTWPED
jgi:hypothetical protein